MTKQEFISQLREKLSGLPQSDIEESITFYSEMIDDKIEDGMTEENAVSELGGIDDIVKQIIADTPLTRLVKEKIRPKRKRKAWEIVLIAVGSPIWASLLIAALAVIFSVWVCLWAIVISFWAADVSLAASALGSFASGIIGIVNGDVLHGIFMIGAGLICTGLFILLIYGCKALTRLCAVLTRKMAIAIKSLFIRREEA